MKVDYSKKLQHTNMPRSQLKRLGRKCLILGEKQYFVWGTSSQSTQLIDMLNIWGNAHLGSHGYTPVCTTGH